MKDRLTTQVSWSFFPVLLYFWFTLTGPLSSVSLLLERALEARPETSASVSEPDESLKALEDRGTVLLEDKGTVLLSSILRLN